MKKPYHVVLTSSLLVFVGCLPMRSTQLKPGLMYFKAQPLINCEKDPEAGFDRYRTFTTVPIAETYKQSNMNPIAEKQLLYLVRCNLETLGYTFVAERSKADLAAVVCYSDEYKEQYIPPSSYTIPLYMPGQTQSFNFSGFTNSYGNAWGNGTNIRSNSYGAYSGSGTVQTPGQYVPMTVTAPGYYEGAFYPCFLIGVGDLKTKKLIWSGTSVCATPEGDIRKSGQVMISRMLLGGQPSNFPPYKDAAKWDDAKDGAFGLILQPVTENGNDFYPYVYAMFSECPAYRQGIRPFDIITQIDGQSMLNKPSSFYLVVLDKSKGDSVTLTINRGTKTFDVTVRAEDENVARQKWKVAKMIDVDGKVRSRKVER